MTTERNTIIAPGDLRRLVQDWDLSLRALRRSEATREGYQTSIDQLTAYLVNAGMPTEVALIRREHVEAWLADLADRGKSPATCNKRYMAVRVFFNWCVEEGEVTDSPMAKMKPPPIPEVPVPVVSEGDLKRLLKVTEGAGLVQRRDHALILLLL